MAEEDDLGLAGELLAVGWLGWIFLGMQGRGREGHVLVQVQSVFLLAAKVLEVEGPVVVAALNGLVLGRDLERLAAEAGVADDVGALDLEVDGLEVVVWWEGVHVSAE